MTKKFNDGFETNIYKWDVEKPKAIMQIVHGSAEHASRYDHFAKWLNKKGIAVWAMDLKGHGQLEKDRNNLGYFGKKGYINVLRNINEFGIEMKEQYPNVPYTLFGHSMGSFIVRSYSLMYSDIDKLIAMGTNNFSRVASKAQYWYASFLDLIMPQKHKAKFLDKLSYKKFDRMVKAEHSGEWLSKSETNIEEFKNDDLCGFTFTNNGFKTMMKWIDIMGNKSRIINVKDNLEILFISGSHDPVGNFGKGPEAIYNIYRKYNKQAELILMDDLKHEILNEDNKEEVYKPIIDFIIKK